MMPAALNFGGKPIRKIYEALVSMQKKSVEKSNKSFSNECSVAFFLLITFFY